MHNGYYSNCGFNLVTISCPLHGGNKYEGILEQNTSKNITIWSCESENHKMSITCTLHLVP